LKSEKLPGIETGIATVTPRTSTDWLTWLTGSTLFASLSYGSCYLTGLVYHQAYLSRFDVPSDLFKASIFEYFIYAYIAWIELMPAWLNLLTGDYRPIAFFFFLLVIGTGLGISSVVLSNTRKGKALHTALQNSKLAYLMAGLAKKAMGSSLGVSRSRRKPA
jgi:hypothetical protein